ncbi:FHA domain-containing protein [bacterium]|nr:FHA domain-containing protein [bacterium]
MATGPVTIWAIEAEEEITVGTSVEVPASVHPYLEVHALLAAGGERWLTLSSHPLQLDGLGPGATGWSARVEGESVEFLAPALWQGGQVASVRLVPGDSLQLEGCVLWLLDARRPERASLEAYQGLEGLANWNLRPQAYRIGRRSSGRDNHIEINHPTVSRAQACLLPHQVGRFALLAESTTSLTAVNGRLLGPNEHILLQHGDLIHLGEVCLRFRQTGPQVLGPQLLSVWSLGRFEVQWGQSWLSETQWKVEKAGWLLARLAWSWGQPISTHQLMESFWPGLPELRGRKNLSQCLISLKRILQVGESGLILRSASSLQLNPSFLAEHDAALCRELAAGTQPAGWEKALALYQGPYLPACFEDWALAIRAELLQAVLGAAQKLANFRYDGGDWEGCLHAASRGLQWDGCQQELALLVMESCGKLGRSEQAIRCFEGLRKQLHKELEVEPSIELLRAYQKARA